MAKLKFKNDAKSREEFTYLEYVFLTTGLFDFCEMDDPEGLIDGSFNPWTFWVTQSVRGINENSKKGVLGSLVKKGYLYIWDDDDETTLEVLDKLGTLIEVS